MHFPPGDYAKPSSDPRKRINLNCRGQCSSDSSDTLVIQVKFGFITVVM